MKIAIIGCGRQGFRRAKAAKDCGDEIIAVADTTPESAASLAEAYKCTSSTDWTSLIKDKNIEAVIICTPNDTHAAITIAALNEGKHVLCEKPLARNPEEIRQIEAAAKDSKAILKCGFNHRHHPAIVEAKKILEEGTLGTVLFMRCRYGITGRLNYENDWRTKALISGGGELMDQGQHALDIFRWFGGDITEVTGYAKTLYWDIKPVEDNAFAILHANAGHICMMHVSWTEWRNIFSFEVFGDKGYAKVDGLGGSYGIEKLTTGAKDLSGPFVENVKEFKQDDISWVEEWKEFHSAIAQKRSPLGSLEDGAAAVRLAYAIYDSSAKGSKVMIDKK